MKKFIRQRMPEGEMIILHQIDPISKIEVEEGYFSCQNAHINKTFQEKDYTLILSKCESEDIDIQYHLLKRCWKWYKSQLILDFENYQLEPSEDLGFWICTDKKNLFVCKFEEGNFNDNQTITILEDCELEAVALAGVCAKMADWLRKVHYDKIF